MTSDASKSKRKNIIKGATVLFLKHGLHTVSMDKVAQAAPVSKATLYKYFRSKDALLAAVIDELCADLWQTMDKVSLGSGDIENNLNKIATAFVNLFFSEQGLAMYRLVVAECSNNPEIGVLVYNSGPKNILSMLENYLTEINEQQKTISDVEFSADAFLSLLKGELHFQCLLGIKPPPSAIEKKQHINKVVTFFYTRVV